jgi:hypothetical protein
MCIRMGIGLLSNDPYILPIYSGLYRRLVAIGVSFFQWMPKVSGI